MHKILLVSVVLFSLFLSLPTQAEECFYRYPAIVTAVYDADTITVDINLGLEVWKRGEKIRLARIDAPEMKGKEKAAGTVSRDWLRSQILNRNVTIQTDKDKKGKYGRYIGEVFWGAINMSDALVKRRLAVYKDYDNG